MRRDTEWVVRAILAGQKLAREVQKLLSLLVEVPEQEQRLREIEE